MEKFKNPVADRIAAFARGVSLRVGGHSDQPGSTVGYTVGAVDDYMTAPLLGSSELVHGFELGASS